MRRVPWWALVSSLAAPLLLIGGWTVAAAVQPRPFDPVIRTISDLAASDTPERWLMTIALFGVGVSHLVTASGLRPARDEGRLVLGLGGLSTLLVAAFPLPTGGGSSTTHTAAAAVSFVSLAVWPAFGCTGRLGREKPQAALLAARVCGSVTGMLLLTVAWFFTELLVSGQRVGLAERVAAGAQALWPLAVVVSVRASQTPPRTRDGAGQERQA